MFGIRLWHPDDRAALSAHDFQAISKAIDTRIADDEKEARNR
jgi:hypothetical protein